ncbi:hypothetical protein TESG_05293 [Trichophyton tonsurans CBS 112818]|uniref:Uncharacterized protein n=1 Tax=Trichophyton tonsurans (strain CBS 112818) TaxID=647933 RepID=F2S355_TRIT1|nr:hypothetical protein TESG_05293 [Trichophyton tonsurans CBS 112818]
MSKTICLPVYLPTRSINIVYCLSFLFFHSSRKFQDNCQLSPPIQPLPDQPITSVLFLAGLCRRRRWPEPLYEQVNNGSSGSGYTCVVRVNNREYQTDEVCQTELLAREKAAMRAYLICRNFSVNDGMYPAGHDHGGVVQGIPVAIGKDRRPRYSDDTDTSTTSSGDSRSGGSSPESYERKWR